MRGMRRTVSRSFFSSFIFSSLACLLSSPPPSARACFHARTIARLHVSRARVRPDAREWVSATMRASVARVGRPGGSAQWGERGEVKCGGVDLVLTARYVSLQGARTNGTAIRGRTSSRS